MKIAVSSSGPGRDASVDPRFGRCRYFVLTDPATTEWETLENENATSGGGAGIRTAQLVIDRGVRVVITGNCGPNAYQTLSAAGIELVTGASGRVQDALEAYRNGELALTPQANVGAHYGTSGGRGMGRGGGRGIGRTQATAPSPSGRASTEDPLTDLATQLRALSREIEGLHRRLDKIEGNET